MASKENKQHKQNLKYIKKALKIFPKLVKEKERASREREKILKNFAPMSRKLKKLEDAFLSESTPKKVHPWRKCPSGQHWVSSHPMHVPVSGKNPDGVTTRDGHCRTNPSKKDQIYSDEILEIAVNNFSTLDNLPTADDLDERNGNEYDHLIGGWTQYWNEVLAPKTKLDPNLVKALIATESEFDVKAKALASKGNWARGLMQITDETVKILKDEKGELKNFLVNVDQGDAHDPNLNICAGVRWLFHKKNLLEKRKRRTVSWEDAAMEYKAFTKSLKSRDKTAVREWEKFLRYYEKLRK